MIWVMKTKGTVKFSYYQSTSRLISSVCTALSSRFTIRTASEMFRGVINSYYGLSVLERKKLYDHTIGLFRYVRSHSRNDGWMELMARRPVFDEMVKTTRSVQATATSRWKRQELRIQMSSTANIFFLCSVHQNPAEDHAEYQGKVYVDMHWRQKVNGVDYYKVGSYIKNHRVKTVQWAMGYPVWLTTRPYCKHFFIPLDTETVLTSSLNNIIAGTEGAVRREALSTVDMYYDQRRRLYANLYKKWSSRYFDYMANKKR